MEKTRRGRVLHYVKRGLEGLLVLAFFKALKKSRAFCEKDVEKPRHFARTRAFLKEKAKKALKRGQ